MDTTRGRWTRSVISAPAGYVIRYGWPPIGSTWDFGGGGTVSLWGPVLPSLGFHGLGGPSSPRLRCGLE
jgi:hypothetical protein